MTVFDDETITLNLPKFNDSVLSITHDGDKLYEENILYTNDIFKLEGLVEQVIKILSFKDFLLVYLSICHFVKTLGCVCKFHI